MTGDVHRFRLAGRPLLGIAFGSLALFLLLVLGAIAGPDHSRIDLLVLLFSAVFLGGLAAGALWLRKRSPVALEVGPAGIRPALWTRPMPWSEISAVRRETAFAPIGPGRDVLVFELVEGAMPPARAAGPAWIGRWYRERQGLRVPIQALAEEGDTVVASVARFVAVAE